ncbi:hypothetical protein ACFWTE_28695 [Nocardiopsis sp. NPDC058631]|uniref:hypothetical protein n=1 Tax=Nocardiopsis sp. NPDC058631 TaxID=3346566 RepID=UPI00364A8474
MRRVLTPVALTALAALFVLAPPPPASAGDWRYDEMATVRASALAEDPLYVGALHRRNVAEQDAEALRARLADASTPVYVVLVGQEGRLDDYVADLAHHADTDGSFFVVGRDGVTLHGARAGAHDGAAEGSDPAELTAEAVNADAGLAEAPLAERLVRAVDIVEGGGPADGLRGSPLTTAAAFVLGAALLATGAWWGIGRWARKPLRVAPLTETVARNIGLSQQEEYRERLTERLTGCGRRVAAQSAGSGRVGPALEAYGAAAKVLDAAADTSDLVGVHVLLDMCDAALDDRPAPPHCFFDPRHGGATADVRWRAPASFHSIRVLACRVCRKAVRDHRTPAAVPDASGSRPLPYYAVAPEESVWAATGYGTLDPDLPGRVARGEHRRAGQDRRSS